jgi:hypothetical protein
MISPSKRGAIPKITGLTTGKTGRARMTVRAASRIPLGNLSVEIAARILCAMADRKVLASFGRPAKVRHGSRFLRTRSHDGRSVWWATDLPSRNSHFRPWTFKLSPVMGFGPSMNPAST